MDRLRSKIVFAKIYFSISKYLLFKLYALRQVNSLLLKYKVMAKVVSFGIRLYTFLILIWLKKDSSL